MGANKPKRNHYIPELLLHNFCDDDGFLWAADKSGRRPFHPPPSKLFVEKHLYATTDYDQSVKTFENEDALAKIESAAGRAISAIIEQARQGSFPRLSPEDNDRFKRFIVAQARRTPESQERIGLYEAVDEIFPEAVSMFKEKFGSTLVDDDWYAESSLLELKQRYKSNLSGNYAAGAHPLLEQGTSQFCRDAGWLVAVIDMPKRSFVIGSNAFAVVEQGGQIESWLPIAHDVAIRLTGFPDREYMLTLNRNNESIIRTINQSTVASSRFIAGRSKELIESLMGGYWQRNLMAPAEAS